jgi:hypothetical protein
MKRINLLRISLVLFVVATLIAGFALVSNGQGTDTGFTGIVTSGRIVAGSYMQATTYMQAGTSVTAGTAITAGTGLNVGTTVKFTPAAATTVTDTYTLNVTAAVMPLTSSAEVTVTTITAATAGNQVLLINQGSNTVNLFDNSGTLRLTGDFAMGQYDTLLLYSDGTRWLEVARSNN